MAAVVPTDEVQSHDVEAAGSLTWLGHATVVLTTQSGTRIVFDPWLDGNPKCEASVDDLGGVDAIVVTHGHFDHIGSVVPLATATGATVVCVPELAAYFGSMGVANLVEMNKGGTVQVADVTVTMVTADHSCGIAVGEGQPHVYGGNPVGFVIGLPAGQGGPVYFSGDTNVFGDMSLIKDLYAPEIALIPIDGHYNMGPREAAHAVTLLGVNRVVPIHYGTFPILTGSPTQLQSFLHDAQSRATMIDIEPGQSVLL